LGLSAHTLITIANSTTAARCLRYIVVVSVEKSGAEVRIFFNEVDKVSHDFFVQRIERRLPYLS